MSDITQNEEEEDTIIQNPPVNTQIPPAEPAEESTIPTSLDDEDSIETAPPSEQSMVDNDDDDDMSSNEIAYDRSVVDLRGVDEGKVAELVASAEAELGARALDIQSRATGSWMNTLLRMMFEPNFEERRIRELLGSLDDAEKVSLSHRYTENGKVAIRTSSVVKKFEGGSDNTLSGDAARSAFEFRSKGNAFRVPLLNSGITIDIKRPTGIDLNTLIQNCQIVDRELGSSSGAHYFLYNDLMFKNQILTFLQPLIVDSSYVDWRKNGQLWSIIKLPDLTSIIAHLAAACYPDGFEGFVSACTRPLDENHKTLCGYKETLKADIFKMIVSRWSVLSADAIQFIVEARSGHTKHSLAQIAEYQSKLGLEGKRITFGDITFTLRVPSLAEHADGGSQFIADIINEIEGDNTEARYEQMGYRYVRTFLPWIAAMEADLGGTVIRTNDSVAIARELERIDDNDPKSDMRNAFIDYIGKTQLTYVGHPVTPCPACNYVADTPSGMWTFDPFTAFFTIASQYLMKVSSQAEKA